MEVNTEYVNALAEIACNEKLYEDPNNLPQILKDFISIAEEKGLTLKIKYGLVNHVVGFRLEINGKAQFIEDYLVEDQSKHDEGRRWFLNSLKETFDK